MSEKQQHNIVYSERGQTLDLFLPVGDEVLRPAALLLHGGGWQGGDRKNMEHLAHWFAAQGFVVANVSYALAPEHRWPSQFQDAAAAVWWLKKNSASLRIDTTRIVAVGISAGGHLAAMLGQRVLMDAQSRVDSRIAALVSIWGPWNLQHTETAAQHETVAMLFAQDSLQARGEASPLQQIGEESVPALLFYGVLDEWVPYAQVQEVCERYAQVAQAECRLITFADLGHQWPAEDARVYQPLKQFLLDKGILNSSCTK